jgi:hypothetical protein
LQKRVTVKENWECIDAAATFGLTAAADVAFFTGAGAVVRAGYNAWRFGVGARKLALGNLCAGAADRLTVSHGSA